MTSTHWVAAAKGEASEDVLTEMQEDVDSCMMILTGGICYQRQLLALKTML